MKKLLALSLVGLLVFTGCGTKVEKVEGSLKEIMDKIYTDVYTDVPEEERPMLGDIDVLTDMPDNIEYYIGTKDIEYSEIYAREPMMGSIAYSVVLVRMKDGADIEAAKTKIAETVKPALLRNFTYRKRCIREHTTTVFYSNPDKIFEWCYMYDVGKSAAKMSLAHIYVIGNIIKGKR